MQFGKIGHMRGDDERRMDKLKEFSRPQDTMLIDLQADDGPVEKDKDDAKKKNSSKLDVIQPNQKKCMTGVDYRLTSLHYNRGITMDKQKTRGTEKSAYLPNHM